MKKPALLDFLLGTLPSKINFRSAKMEDIYEPRDEQDASTIGGSEAQS